MQRWAWTSEKHYSTRNGQLFKKAKYTATYKPTKGLPGVQVFVKIDDSTSKDGAVFRQSILAAGGFRRAVCGAFPWA